MTPEQRRMAALFEAALSPAPEALSAADALEAGTAVGPYVVVREIGRGGMGCVYLATDTRLSRHVALKVLAPHLSGDASFRERLRREARAAAALSHPGICVVHALEEMGDDLVLVHEYIDGETLRDEIAGARRPDADGLVRTAKELATALAAAHARGIAHRDLKPENIMRTAEGRLKILDFGLARMEATGESNAFRTTSGMLVGTPAYMAPEQLNGGTGDARSDVFAFGLVLYEYASGEHPFSAATPLATAARVLERDVPPLSAPHLEVPPVILGVIERCLRKNPDDRFQSGAALVSALSSMATPSARSTDVPAASLGWWRTHQLAIMAIYIGAAFRAWQVKEWLGKPLLPVSIFMGMGLGAAIGGGLRGHLVFTERMNRRYLRAECRRAARPLVIVELAMAAGLIVDALLMPMWPLTAVWTFALAAALGLAALVFDPATTRAVIETEEDPRAHVRGPK